MRLGVCAHAWDDSRLTSIRDPAFITGCYRSTPASKQDRPLFVRGRPLFEEIRYFKVTKGYLIVT